MTTRFLEVRELQGWYGESHVLHGVNFHVDEGEVVTLLGRNGAGRTSTLRAIMGLIGRRLGSIRIRGQEAIAMPTHRIARLGIGYCPEERGIFSTLSAEENLMLPPRLSDSGMGIDQIYTMFPNLKERAGSSCCVKLCMTSPCSTTRKRSASGAAKRKFCSTITMV